MEHRSEHDRQPHRRPSAKDYADFLKLTSAAQQASCSSYIYDFDGVELSGSSGIGLLLLQRS